MITKETLEPIIAQLRAGETSAAGHSFNQVLTQEIATRLDTIKQSVAKNFLTGGKQ